jgi:hypothetical protein
MSDPPGILRAAFVLHFAGVGLMFVVTLVSEFRGTTPQIDAFGTPAVVHFSGVLS